MSTIPGNPHFDPIDEYLTVAHQFAADQDANILARAQIEATLALAFEQRTANLIALYSAEDWSNQMTTAKWESVTLQITERLGLTEGATK